LAASHRVGFVVLAGASGLTPGRVNNLAVSGCCTALYNTVQFQQQYKPFVTAQQYLWCPCCCLLGLHCIAFAVFRPQICWLVVHDC
jgi:hypothetical protein